MKRKHKPSIIDAITKARTEALLMTAGPFGPAAQKRIVEYAAKNRLPAIYYRRQIVEDGGLMSYDTNRNDSARRAATFVDKILKGVKPADLPVEQPTKFELVINLKAATDRSHDPAPMWWRERTR
jgi:putative tryptophan/tyrosine transport system substrate-binding protein